MKFKKIAVFFAAAIMMSSLMAFNVSAKNNADTTFDFTVIADSSIATNLIFRQKEDTSAPYCYLQIAASNGFNMRILSINNSLSASSIVDATKGDTHIYAEQKRLIRCTVMDAGRKYCTIAAKSYNNQSSGRAKGVWSPDSLGTYTYAN